MKKILTFLAIVCIAIQTFAQSGCIQLYVSSPKQVESVPEASIDYLVNNICSAVTIDGLAAQSDYMTQFLLRPKINVVSKSVLANTQQQIALTLDVTLQVVDNLSGTVFTNNTITVKGVGMNETKAYNAAFRALNKSNQKVIAFCSSAKEKIMAYYEAESVNIIKKAKILAAQEKYDEAFYLLSMIPSQCSKFDDAISASLDIWQKYKDYSCAVNVAKARSAWVATQDMEGADKAATYLSNILPDASCYADAMKLYDEIRSGVGNLWKFEMKKYDKESELRKAKIDAIQSIGVAYGKGQQPNVLINKHNF